MTLLSHNPFISGNPVAPADFVNRQREARRLVTRICTGQSSAVIGEPRSGKTSLLHYVRQPDLYGEQATHILFSYLDAQMLGPRFAPPHFWEYVLQPVVNLSGTHAAQVRTAYAACQRETFGNFGLERLFAQLASAGYRLGLLLDEFDNLLENAAFHQAEFFGGLRSLASRMPGLVLVLASRQLPGALNQQTQEFNRSGSPYFNFVDEIILAPFSKRATEDLLARGGDRFTAADHAFILRLADGHPYFLQVVAGELWDLSEETDLTPVERHRQAGEALYTQTQKTLADTWRLWTPEMRKAFAVIALDQMPRLLGAKEFYLRPLRQKLADYGLEVRELKKRGYIRENAAAESEWSITGEVMLWFVADALLQALRAQDDLGTLVQAQQWAGLFTKEEIALVGAALKSVSKLVTGGVETFIKAASEGWGKGVSGKP
jgi:hypothetical protein